MTGLVGMWAILATALVTAMSEATSLSSSDMKCEKILERQMGGVVSTARQSKDQTMHLGSTLFGLTISQDRQPLSSSC